MDARLIMGDLPGAWVEFTSGGEVLRARMDPLWLGVDDFPELLTRPRLVLRLLDERSQITAMISDPFGDRFPVLLTDYAEAVGLGLDGLAGLGGIFDHLSLLEVDLLRLGLDIRDWLAPEGPLSSRRVWLLVKDLRQRPESQIGAMRMGIHPADKAAIVAAQALTAKAEDKSYKHYFLRSPADLEREEKQLRLDAEKRARIEKQQTVTLQQVTPGTESFQSAQQASLEALEEIMAAQGG